MTEQHRERTYDLGFSLENQFAEEPEDLLEQFRQFETNVEAFDESPRGRVLFALNTWKAWKFSKEQCRRLWNAN